MRIADALPSISQFYETLRQGAKPVGRLQGFAGIANRVFTLPENMGWKGGLAGVFSLRRLEGCS